MVVRRPMPPPTENALSVGMSAGVVAGKRKNGEAPVVTPASAGRSVRSRGGGVSAGSGVMDLQDMEHKFEQVASARPGKSLLSGGTASDLFS